MRIGQKNGLVYQWAKKGTRPRQPKDQRYLDKAGWHTTRKLHVPANISLLHLPPASPELNPTENIWQYLRQSYLSNRVFRDYDAVVEASGSAWNKLTAEHGRIASIGTRGWTAISQGP